MAPSSLGASRLLLSALSLVDSARCDVSDQTDVLKSDKCSRPEVTRSDEETGIPHRSQEFIPNRDSIENKFKTRLWHEESDQEDRKEDEPESEDLATTEIMQIKKYVKPKRYVRTNKEYSSQEETPKVRHTVQMLN